jgi:hypothetical protein
MSFRCPEFWRHRGTTHVHPVSIQPYYQVRQINSVPPFEFGPSQSMVGVRILRVAVSA